MALIRKIFQNTVGHVLRIQVRRYNIFCSFNPFCKCHNLCLESDILVHIGIINPVCPERSLIPVRLFHMVGYIVFPWCCRCNLSVNVTVDFKSCQVHGLICHIKEVFHKLFCIHNGIAGP